MRSIHSLTAGCHPHNAKNYKNVIEIFDKNKGYVCSEYSLLKLLQEEKVVAVGECGLDYDGIFSGAEYQIYTFKSQLNMAMKTKKPDLILYAH